VGLTQAGSAILAVFDDTCGSLIQLAQQVSSRFPFASHLQGKALYFAGR
jgi:hypothetical protein